MNSQITVDADNHFWYKDMQEKHLEVSMPIQKICVNCGKEFFVPPIRKNKARFCSSKCKNEMGGWGTKKIQRVCQTCGKTFEVWENWVNRGQGKFCSRKCNNRKKLDSAEIVAMYDSGLSSVQIATKLNVKGTTIRRRLHEAGIQMRTDEEGIRLAYKDITGVNHHSWKGGRFFHKRRSKGYWMIYKPEHPRANKRGYVSEHIFEWEQSNEKELPKGWVVHHKNCDPTDNRPENLEAMPWGKHTKLHNDLRIKELADCKATVERLIAENAELKARLAKLN